MEFCSCATMEFMTRTRAPRHLLPRTVACGAVIVLALGFIALTTFAQIGAQKIFQPQTQHQQAQSLAEIARQVRAERKNAPKASIVWTNYNLPTQGGVSVVGQPVGNMETATALATNDESTILGSGARNPGNGAARAAELNSQLAQARQRLASLRIDLDLIQRRLTLDQHQFDSNPNGAADKDGAAHLRAERQQLADKARAVALAESEVAALEQKPPQTAVTAKPGASNTPNP
jgi:hypothetical protein